MFTKYTEYKYKHYSFDFKDKRWKDYLKNHGFVVIKEIENEDVCNQYKNELWNVLKCFSKTDLDKPENKKWSKNYPTSLHGGMYTIGHTKTQWKIREKSKYIFEDIWNNKDLVCSFDRFTYYPKERKYKNVDISDWIHSDQSYYNDIDSYQGMLCLSDNMIYKSGGFVCIPKSNLIHKKICELDNQKNKNDWVKLSKEFKKKYVQNENILKVKNRKGDFVIWDSKTIHSGFAPINTKNENYDRIVVYVCMRMRKELNKKNANKRKMAFKDKRCTSHNPINFSLFCKNLGRFSGMTPEEVMNIYQKNNLLVDWDINHMI